MSRTSTAGLAAAGTAVTSWGLGNVMARFIALTGPSLAFDRQWFGVAYSLALCAALRRRLGWRTLRLALPGGLAFGVQGLFFFTAVKHTAVTDATIIVALQPALLLCVVGRLFGEKVRAADAAATVTALGGTALVVLGGRGRGGDHLSGDLLAVASLVLWAAYFVAAKQARRHLGTVEYQTALAMVAAVAVTPVALLYGGALWTGWSTAGWVVLLALGPGGGHFLMN
ncbi:MAG TPA: DMT family transporter, partial [Acidimicrobiales bacterium]|nr:DMT family transporter [Acidimicrobiales bacterium]